MDDRFDKRRSVMASRDIAGRGIADERVIAAMAEVPRERFVAPAQSEHAYDDRALPIGHHQTISQPYVVGVMLEALHLQPTDHLLEIGSGSGYAAAVASRVCQRVVGVERIRALAKESAERLSSLGYDNVSIVEGDGSLGWLPEAPYDAVLVSAAAPAVPAGLLDQLADGGRMVIPVSRSKWSQELLQIRRTGDHIEQRDLGGVAFVPLIGASGWSE